MKRVLHLFAFALFGVGLLAGCDATSPAVAPSPPADAVAAIESIAADFDRAYAALDAETQRDDAAVAALLDAIVARHNATAGRGGTRARFGPFNISFGQQQTRTGTLNGVNEFDLYLYNVTGTATGELEGRMEAFADNVQVTAILAVNGAIRDRDTNEDNVTAEAIVTAPTRAIVGVAFASTPPGGFPAGYEHRIEFQNPD